MLNTSKLIPNNGKWLGRDINSEILMHELSGESLLFWWICRLLPNTDQTRKTARYVYLEHSFTISFKKKKTNPSPGEQTL